MVLNILLTIWQNVFLGIIQNSQNLHKILSKAQIKPMELKYIHIISILILDNFNIPNYTGKSEQNVYFLRTKHFK